MAETPSLLPISARGGACRRRAPAYEQKLDAQGRAYATGKRKNAVARVWIKPGQGKITVNERDRRAYFARPVLRMMICSSRCVANRADQYDVVVTVAGGGLSGQAGAVRHGLVQGADLFRAGAAPGAQEGRLPDPRPARRRAQEVRQDESPPQLPVLEAVAGSGLDVRRGRLRAALFVSRAIVGGSPWQPVPRLVPRCRAGQDFIAPPLVELSSADQAVRPRFGEPFEHAGDDFRRSRRRLGFSSSRFSLPVGNVRRFRSSPFVVRGQANAPASRDAR